MVHGVRQDILVEWCPQVCCKLYWIIDLVVVVFLLRWVASTFPKSGVVIHGREQTPGLPLDPPLSDWVAIPITDITTVSGHKLVR